MTATTVAKLNAPLLSPNPSGVSPVNTVVFDPTYYGADPTGSKDSTTAINLLTAAVRNTITNTIAQDFSTTYTIDFPPGVYLCNGTLNFTGLNASNLVINFNGALIRSRAAGLPSIDMLGSSNFVMYDLMLYGDSANRPTYGIQRGRITTIGGAGKIKFYNPVIDGYFSRASEYNLAGEVNYNAKPRYTNRANTAGAYVLIMDGNNYENITSQFVTQTIPVGTATSFNENYFVSPEFRQLGNQPVVLITGDVINRHSYINGYARTDANYVFEIANSTLIRQLEFDVHVEASTVTKFLVVDNVNPASTIQLPGLKIRDHQPFCTDSLIDTTGTTQAVVFDNLDIDLGDPPNTIPIFGATAGANKIFAEGVIKWPSSKTLSMGPANFSGTIFTKSTNTVTPSPGSYRIIRRPDVGAGQIEKLKGTFQFGGTSSGTDDSNYLEISGAGASGFPYAQPGGTATDLPGLLLSKGAGALIAQIPDSTATGGNARGSRAVDFQKNRSANTQVASGTEATIAGGRANTATGAQSFTAGDTNIAGGATSVALGGSNTTNGIGSFAAGQNNSVNSGSTNGTVFGRYGQVANRIGGFAIGYGQSGTLARYQEVRMGLVASITNSAANIVMTADGAAAGGANEIVLVDNSALLFEGKITARDITTGATKGWTILGNIKRDTGAATTALLGAVTPTVVGTPDAATSLWAVTVTSATGSGSLRVQFSTGSAVANTVRAIATMTFAEVQ